MKDLEEILLGLRRQQEEFNNQIRKVVDSLGAMKTGKNEGKTAGWTVVEDRGKRKVISRPGSRQSKRKTEIRPSHEPMTQGKAKVKQWTTDPKGLPVPIYEEERKDTGNQEDGDENRSGSMESSKKNARKPPPIVLVDNGKYDAVKEAFERAEI